MMMPVNTGGSYLMRSYRLDSSKAAKAGLELAKKRRDEVAKRKRRQESRTLSKIPRVSDEPLQLQRAVEEAEQDIIAGNWTEHREVMKKLKKWIQG
jgi:hypothetical protein